MAINLLNIKPHKVSRDLSGYITFVYGAPKTGKTTLATQMDGSLFLAFEPGYHALPGVIAQDVLTWGEMKQIYRELKKPEVQAIYKSIIIDTIDIAADRCKKYICQQNGIEDLGDLGYGKGWTKFKDEFNEVFRGLTQLGYAVFFIGHHKEVTITDSAGQDHIVIRPALSNSTREVIAGMADIYGYAHQVAKDKMSVLTLRDTSGIIECGCRFKYIPTEITLNYQNLVTAIQEAIDKEAAENNNAYVTDDRLEVPTVQKYDFEALRKEFGEIVGELIQKDREKYSPHITRIVEKYLGRGKKVTEATADQAEFVYLIVREIKDELCN